MLPSQVTHPEFGKLKVLSIGHFPDTVMVEDESGKQFEIEAKTLFQPQGKKNETNPRK
jgi:hypothetical protein